MCVACPKLWTGDAIAWDEAREASQPESCKSDATDFALGLM